MPDSRAKKLMNVCQSLRENGTIYTIDEPLLCELRPDVLLTQKLCDVCAVGYGTVARLAETLPGLPRVVDLEPSSLSDIFDDIRRIARTCDVTERAKELVTKFSTRVEVVRERAARIAHRPPRPGPRIIDSIEILAGILHSNEFPEFTLRNFQIRRVAQPDLAAP